MTTPDTTGAAPWQVRYAAADRLLADTTQDGLTDLDDHPSVAALGGLDATLRYLHERWVTHFGVLLDDDLDGPIVATAWRTWSRLAEREPALARILSHHADHPVVRSADDAHRALLAQASLTTPDLLPSWTTPPAAPLTLDMVSTRRRRRALRRTLQAAGMHVPPAGLIA